MRAMSRRRCRLEPAVASTSLQSPVKSRSASWVASWKLLRVGCGEIAVQRQHFRSRVVMADQACIRLGPHTRMPNRPPAHARGVATASCRRRCRCRRQASAATFEFIT